MTALRSLPGLGPATARWLQEAGIRTAEELRELGPVEAYRRIKFMFPREANANALYALEAGLRGCHWLRLPPEVKADLQRQAKLIAERLSG